MRKRLRLKTILLGYLASFSLIASIVGAYAWFQSEIVINNISGTGSSEGAYFAYGDGTSEHPFGINEPRHLYNLAWLQYNGMFNKDEKNNGSGASGSDGAIDKQYHFEIDPSLSSPLDMTGWTLPPIGTERHPFLGSFNGNNKTITGLTTSNQAAFAQKPTSINYDVQPEIVGFFGVVGSPTSLSYTYDSSIVSLSNVTLDTITVESKTSQTLIGLAAGYVDGAMSGVKVGGTSTLDVNGQVSTAKTSITNKLSDYGLVGYSKLTGGSGSYSQSVSTWYDAFDPAYGGSARPSLGGHTSIDELYNRLDSIPKTETHYARKQTQTKYSDGTYSSVSTDNISKSNVLHNYEDVDGYVGSFCFSDSANETSQIEQLCLTGERTVKKEISDESSTETMIFFNNAYYQTYTSATYIFPRNNESDTVYSQAGPAYEADPSKENGWFFTQSSFELGTTTALGALYSVDSNGNKYYLCLYKNPSTNNVLAKQRLLTEEPTSPEFRWTLEYQANKTIPKTNGVSQRTAYIYSTLNGTKYYLASSGYLGSTASNNKNRFYTRTKDFPSLYVEDSNLHDNYDTYFPLITSSDNDHSASLTNTGYIVSGSDYEPFTNLKGSGSLYVSKYTQSGGVWDFSADKTKNTIRTVYGNVSSDVLAQSITDYDDFSSRYDDFNPSINYPSYFYGLRFNDSAVSTTNITTIEKGKLNGATFENRPMPRNCIDFSLASKGTTAFFAGTFHEGTTDAFFSLHQINRSGSSIVSIEEILQIYRHKTISSKPYIYKTSVSNPSIDSNYELVFDTSWLTNPTSVTSHKIYYFEIPLNAGEYAMAGVPNKKGAYLMYFDIGASEVGGLDSVYGYAVTTSGSSVAYPLGVDFALSAGSASGGGTICLSIASSKKGRLTLVVSGSNINISDSSSISKYAYQGPGLGKNFTVSGDPPDSLDQAQNVSTKTIYAFVTTAGGDNHSIVITVGQSYVLDGTSYNSLSDLLVAAPVFGESNYEDMLALSAAVTLTKSGSGINFNIVPEFLVSDRTKIVINLDVSGISVTTSDIGNDYKIYKEDASSESNRMSNGTTYSF